MKSVMKKTLQLIGLLLLTSLLGGCVLFHGYAPPVQQGNVIKAASLNQLHLGMSKSKVLDIMGPPVLTNTFRDNSLDYIYTYQIYGHRLAEKKVIISFSNGRISRITKNLNIGMMPKNLVKGRLFGTHWM